MSDIERRMKDRRHSECGKKKRYESEADAGRVGAGLVATTRTSAEARPG